MTLSWVGLSCPRPQVHCDEVCECREDNDSARPGPSGPRARPCPAQLEPGSIPKARGRPCGGGALREHLGSERTVGKTSGVRKSLLREAGVAHGESCRPGPGRTRGAHAAQPAGPGPRSRPVPAPVSPAQPWALSPWCPTHGPAGADSDATAVLGPCSIPPSHPIAWQTFRAPVTWKGVAPTSGREGLGEAPGLSLWEEVCMAVTAVCTS